MVQDPEDKDSCIDPTLCPSDIEECPEGKIYSECHSPCNTTCPGPLERPCNFTCEKGESKFYGGIPGDLQGV